VQVHSANNLMLLPTPLNNTYGCSVETQVEVIGNETEAGLKDVYLRIIDISDLQAFVPTGKGTASMLNNLDKAGAVIN